MATDPSPSPSNPADKQSAHDNRANRPRRSWRWLLWPGIVCFACGVAIVVLQVMADALDYGAVNIATLILGFIALMAIVLRVLFRREFSWTMRAAPLTLLILAAVVAAAVLRVDRVTGRMIPELKLRWSPKPDQLLKSPEASPHAVPVDLRTTTTRDFPQFLGPDRNLVIPDIALARDWKRRRPEKLWKQPIGAGWSGFSVVHGFAVTMEQRGAKEMVTCYELQTGKLRWSHAFTTRHETVLGGVGPRCTPTIDQGRVFALGATGILRCLDGATGQLVWSDNILERYGVSPKQDKRAVAWGRAASPLVVDDLLIVPFGGPKGGPCASLAAYEKQTGKIRWKAGDTQVSYSSPALAELCGMRQIIIVNESNVTGHRVGDGRVLWSHRWPGSSVAGASVSQAVVVPGDRVLLSKAYGGGAELLQLGKAGAERLAVDVAWKSRRVLKTKFTNVAVVRGFVYGLSDGVLECVELDTGKSRWKNRRHGNFGHGQILAVGDVILVQAESGEVVMVEANPRELLELGRFEALTDQTWNNLCLYGPYLLARNASQAACYRLPLRPEGKP